MTEDNGSKNSTSPANDPPSEDKSPKTASPGNGKEPSGQTDDNGSGDDVAEAEGERLGNIIRLGISLFGSLAGTAGVLYALGFLVVNISLLSYGVYEIGLLRERYVSAGAAFILLLTTIAVFWYYFIPSGLFRFLRFLNCSLSKKDHQFLRSSIFAKLVIIGALLLISGVATAFLGFIWKISTDPIEILRAIAELTEANFRSQRASNLLSTKPVFFWCLLVSLIFALVWGKIKWGMVKADLIKIEEQVKKRDKTKALLIKYENQEEKGKRVEKAINKLEEQGEKRGKDKQPSTKVQAGEKKAEAALWDMFKEKWAYLLLIIVLLFLALVVYARNVFPALPAAMGGGLPIVVQFSVREDKDMRELIQLGIPVEENKPNLTRQITLIAQTSSSYIVLVSHPELKQNVAVSISKDHVDGIIYYPEEYFLNDEYVAELRTQEGRDALAQGDNQTAIETFKRALDRKGNYLPALIGLGDAYVALFTACTGGDCNIDDAIDSYKEVLNQPRSRTESGEGITPGTEMNLFAEALYKLARAYALSPPDPENALLDYRCQPGDEVTERIQVHPLQTAIHPLRCAIELVEEMDLSQNYAELARNDEAFNSRVKKLGTEEIAELRTEKEFVLLLFPSLEDAVSGYGLTASNLQELGQNEEAIDRYTWAITILEEQKLDLVDSQEEKARLYFNRAGLYLQLGGGQSQRCEDSDCLDIAIKDFQEAVNLEGDNPTYLTELADAQRAASQLKDALNNYKQVTDSEDLSGHAPAWVGLGETYLLLSKNLQARDAFSQAIAIQSGSAAAFYGRAKAEVQIDGNVDQVTSDLRKAIALDERYLHLALGELVFAQITGIQNLLSAERLFEAGQLDEREGNLEEAILKFEKAIELDKINDIYHAALAKAYSELPTPRWTEAESAYQQALALSANNANYHFNLGEVFAAQAKHEQAIESYADAIEIDGGKAIYHDRLSAVLFKFGLVDEAFNAGEAAVRLEPENPDYRFHLAEIYRKIEGWNRAITNYVLIIEKFPDYGDAFCGLAIIYYQSGEGEDAQANLADCLSRSDNQNLMDQAKLARDYFEVQQPGSGD